MRRRRQPGPIEPNGDGTFTINLSSGDRDTMVELLEQLGAIVEGDDDNPRAKRLFPVAYHDNAENESEWQSYMHDELVQSRMAAIGLSIGLLRSSIPVAEADLIAFMTSLNSLRLVLGTLLDVSDDSDPEDVPEDHPAYGPGQLYGYLGWLLGWTVEALETTL